MTYILETLSVLIGLCHKYVESIVTTNQALGPSTEGIAEGATKVGIENRHGEKEDEKMDSTPTSSRKRRREEEEEHRPFRARLEERRTTVPSAIAAFRAARSAASTTTNSQQNPIKKATVPANVAQQQTGSRQADRDRPSRPTVSTADQIGQPVPSPPNSTPTSMPIRVARRNVDRPLPKPRESPEPDVPVNTVHTRQQAIEQIPSSSRESSARVLRHTQIGQSSLVVPSVAKKPVPEDAPEQPFQDDQTLSTSRERSEDSNKENCAQARKKYSLRAGPQPLVPAIVASPTDEQSLQAYLGRYPAAFETIRKSFSLTKRTFTDRVRCGLVTWTKKEEDWAKERGNKPALMLLNTSGHNPDAVPDFKVIGFFVNTNVQYIPNLTFTEKAAEKVARWLKAKNSENCRCSCDRPTKCENCEVGVLPTHFLDINEGGTFTSACKSLGGDHAGKRKGFWSILCNPAVCRKQPCCHVEEKLHFSPLIISMEGPQIGWALRAAVNMLAGSTVAEYTGKVRLVKEKATAPDSHSFNMDKAFVIDAYAEGNEARFLMHSCDPNCIVIKIYDGGRALFDEFSRYFLITKMSVKAGDRLTIDYHAGEDNLNNVNTKDGIKCQCNTKKCRGWLQIGGAAKK